MPLMDISSLTSAYTDYVTQDNSKATQLKNALADTDYSTSTEDELLGACKDFEAYFLEQVFKEMEKTVDVFKEEGSTSNYSNSMVDYFQDDTIQQLAETSTETQGLGLAQTLYEQMKRNYNL